VDGGPTDPELGAQVAEIGDRFDRQSLETWIELSSPGEGADPGFQALGLAFAYSLMTGLALESLVPHQHLVPPQELIDVLKYIAQALGPRAPTVEENTP